MNKHKRVPSDIMTKNAERVLKTQPSNIIKTQPINWQSDKFFTMDWYP